MLGPRAKAQDYQAVGRPHVHCQAAELRTESARRVHMDHVHSLKEPLLKPCLPDAVQACPKIVAALRQSGFASAESALTGRTARAHGRSIQVGDVVLYTPGGGPNGGCNDTRVGEVYFHAMLQGELLVCLSHWPTRREATHWRKVVVAEEFTIVPSAWMLQSVIFTPADVGQQSTVLMPARLQTDPSASDFHE